MKLFRVLPFLLLPLACSEPEFTGDTSEKIIRQTAAIQGGTVDQTSSNVVAILLDTGNGVGICSGSLIAPNLVLTARHCVGDTTGSFSSCSVQPFNTNNPYAVTAFRVSTSYNAAGQVFNGQAGWPTVNNSTWFGVKNIILDPQTNSICGGDVALIHLSAKVPSSICPLIPRVDTNITVGDTYTATGFGITSATGAGAGTRRTVTGMTVACMNSCSGSFCCNSNGVVSGTLEWEGAASTAKGTCEGDSGGPALDSLNRVIGAVSRGPQNACNDTIYGSVYGHGAWIKTSAHNVAVDAGYTEAAWVSGGSTTVNPCATGGGTGVTGGGTGTTGGGTGTTGGGTGTTGGGDPQGSCGTGEVCADFTDQGDFQCIGFDGANYSLPSGSVPCTASGGTFVCATGNTCYNLGNSNYYCFPDCVQTTGTTGGGTGAAGGGTGTTGGGTGTLNPDGCPDPTTCFTGPSYAACLDLNTSNGIPAGAPTCDSATPCATGFTCYGSGTTGTCLRDCPGVPNTCTGGNYCVSWTATDHVCTTSTFDPPAGAQDCLATGACPSGYDCWCTAGTTSCTAASCLQACGGTTGGGTGTTGGGTGTTSGGGTGTTAGGTGTTAGGTGTTAGGTGTTAGGTGTTAGGTGTTAGGTGTTAGGTGTTTGGSGGTTGGSSGTSGGGTGTTTGGSGGTTGGGTGLIWPTGGGNGGGGGSKSDSGCSCTEVPMGSLMWLALSGLGLLRRRRR